MQPKSRRNPLMPPSRTTQWRRRAMRDGRTSRSRIDTLVSAEAHAQFRAVADANNWRVGEALEKIIAAAYAREPRARRFA